MPEITTADEDLPDPDPDGAAGLEPDPDEVAVTAGLIRQADGQVDVWDRDAGMEASRTIHGHWSEDLKPGALVWAWDAQFAKVIGKKMKPRWNGPMEFVGWASDVSGWIRSPGASEGIPRKIHVNHMKPYRRRPEALQVGIDGASGRVRGGDEVLDEYGLSGDAEQTFESWKDHGLSL